MEWLYAVRPASVCELLSNYLKIQNVVKVKRTNLNALLCPAPQRREAIHSVTDLTHFKSHMSDSDAKNISHHYVLVDRCKWHPIKLETSTVELVCTQFGTINLRSMDHLYVTYFSYYLKVK